METEVEIKREEEKEKEMEKEKEKEYKSLMMVVLVTMNSCLGSVILGYMLSVYNPLLNRVQSVLQIEPGQISLMQGIITSIVPLGNAAGALLCTNYSNVSKVRIMKVADMLVIPASILSVISNVYCIIIGRFFMGVASGINSFAIPIYIS